MSSQVMRGEEIETDTVDLRRICTKGNLIGLFGAPSPSLLALVTIPGASVKKRALASSNIVFPLDPAGVLTRFAV